MKFEDADRLVENIVNWMPKEDRACLFEYASKVKGIIVEIGAFHGCSSKILALATKGQVHSCDIFGSYVCKDKYWTGEETKKMCLRNLEGMNNWYLHHMSSLELVKVWSKPIDLLFIDGDHSKESVLDDTKYWLPFVKPNHFVLYHDYHDNDLCPGVKEAVDTLEYKDKLDYYYQGTKSSIKICQK